MFERIAVLGAGVMGAGIAGHLANAGASVLLLDVPGAGNDRNAPAREGMERMTKASPAALMHRRNARRIQVGNLEDDIGRLADVGWVIEAVVENLGVKRALYEKVDSARRPGSVISSNTSTIPLAELVDGASDRFAQDFLITHFFNPPRYMRLLELVRGPRTRAEAVTEVRDYCEVQLGKGVVEAKDTPGFIANRIGNYWLGLAFAAALEDGVPVEVADAVLGQPFGIPRTGVFGLLDLVGLDLMPHVRASMEARLPADDPIHALGAPPAYLAKMIEDGYTGRKGKGGFYRLNREGGGRVKESLDLATGMYRLSERPRLACIEAMRSQPREQRMRALLEHGDDASGYAWRVMSGTLAYCARIVPEIADDVAAVDEAMRLGYRWERGPFELLEALGVDWFADRLAAQGAEPPALLVSASGEGFYREADARLEQRATTGEWRPVQRPAGTLSLADVKRRGPPAAHNASASVWDLGDGVLCLEFTSKLNALDVGTIEMVGRAIRLVGDGRRGLVVYNEAENFSVGANVGLILYMANLASWDMVELALVAGQDAYKALKYAPFPVVGAPSGMALGGGCELLLHCDAVQADAESYIGLVEAGVGLIPGWGGCKEMVVRWMQHDKRPGGPMPALRKVFETVSLATVARSAEEARDHLFLLPRDRVTMNRSRLLADAKSRVLELAEGYTPPTPPEVRLPGPTAKAAMQLAVDGFRALGIATEHDVVVSDRLGQVVSGGDTDVSEALGEDDLLALERWAFLSLLRTPSTLARLEHMIDTGKPLRN